MKFVGTEHCSVFGKGVVGWQKFEIFRTKLEDVKGVSE